MLKSQWTPPGGGAGASALPWKVKRDVSRLGSNALHLVYSRVYNRGQPWHNTLSWLPGSCKDIVNYNRPGSVFQLRDVEVVEVEKGNHQHESISLKDIPSEAFLSFSCFIIQFGWPKNTPIHLYIDYFFLHQINWIKLEIQWAIRAAKDPWRHWCPPADNADNRMNGKLSFLSIFGLTHRPTTTRLHLPIP